MPGGGPPGTCNVAALSPAVASCGCCRGCAVPGDCADISPCHSDWSLCKCWACTLFWCLFIYVVWLFCSGLMSGLGALQSLSACTNSTPTCESVIDELP